MPPPQPNILRTDDLRAGDVLLCYRQEDVESEAGAKIVSVTGSQYTHAAISLGEGRVAEAVKPGGIRTIRLGEWIAQFDHVAVFGHLPDEYWGSDRRLALLDYVGECERGGATFNIAGMFRFEARKEAHESELHDKLDAYFRGESESGTASTGCFFCSQFVASCFIKVGIIEPSAAVLYDPRVISPGSLGRDATFGYFRGYLEGNHEVPITDEFYSETTLDEIHSDD